VSPPEATWCSQCYLYFSTPEQDQDAALSYAAAAPQALAAPPPPPSAPPSTRFPPPTSSRFPPPASDRFPAPASSRFPPPPSAQLPPPPPPPPVPDSAPAGWVPTAGPTETYTAADAKRDGRLLDHRAAVLVVASIGLGGVMQLVALALSHITSIEPEALIRYDIVLTLSMYATVGVMIVSQITPSVRLRWGDGLLVSRIGIGAAVGIGISLALLGIVSAADGHLQSDPRMVLLMSEGDPTHIIVTFLIGCAIAPLVEETLFRGLLLESLRPRGKAVAIIVSAGAFAVWHFMPSSLIYYAALGAVLGGLYLKRGLACSMAAHVGFNAVLTVAALSIVLGPSHTIDVAGLTVTAPSGWSVQTGTAVNGGFGAASLVGPDDAQIEIIGGEVVSHVSAADIAAALENKQLPLPPGLTLDSNEVGEIHSPAGRLVEVGLTADGRHGTLAVLVKHNRSYEVIFLSAGSDRAVRDFHTIMTTLQLN
jgi:membrane protease YdiL (CAAX protease family)